MSAAPWGATPDDWAHLSQRLGLTRDLLPVVSNPSATISPKSKMRDLGKTPSRYDADRQVVGIPSWTTRESDERSIKTWSRDPDLGICLQTRAVRAIDVDIADPGEAARVASFIEIGLGVDLPRRQRADSGKFLLVFKLELEHLPKRVIRTAHGAIEMLGTGQQFIAIGTHPKGARYEWPAGLPAEIPELTLAELDVLWDALAKAFAIPGGASVASRGVMPSIPRRALDMHGDPKVAFLQENGWVREFDRDGRVHIRCPWEDQHTSDSGPTATSYFPAGVGGINAGHYKCLHAHCSGRDDGAFDAAVGWTAAQFEVVEAVAASGEEGGVEWPAFARDTQGRIESTVTNTLLALSRPDISGARLAHDTFRDAIMVAWEGASDWRALGDNDYTRMRVRLEARGFKKPGREMVRECAMLAAEQASIDTAIAWADGLRWDGVPRVEACLHRYFGAADTPYTRAVSRYMWSGLAGRCVEPGVQADMVPVFVGKQGAGKTQGIKALAPIVDTYVEINLEHRDDNLARSLRGKLVGEIAELRGLQGREAEANKAWVSRTHEEWIPKYMEFGVKFPRRLLFIGTTNNEEFLADDTGERRWLPVRTGVVDVDALRRDRDQLWAEAVLLFKAEGVHWRNAHELAEPARNAHKITDVWQELIAAWLAGDGLEGPRNRDHVRVPEILVGALDIPKGKWTKREEMRVAKCLTALGWVKVKPKWEDGQPVRRWERPLAGQAAGEVDRGQKG